MHPTALLLLTVLLWPLGVLVWPRWRAYVLRHWATPEERWERAEAALARAVDRCRESP